MQSGVEESAVKTFAFENFKMEVQKKTKQEFKAEGENNITLQTDDQN